MVAALGGILASRSGGTWVNRSGGISFRVLNGIFVQISGGRLFRTSGGIALSCSRVRPPGRDCAHTDPVSIMTPAAIVKRMRGYPFSLFDDVARRLRFGEYAECPRLRHGRNRVFLASQLRSGDAGRESQPAKWMTMPVARPGRSWHDDSRRSPRAMCSRRTRARIREEAA